MRMKQRHVRVIYTAERTQAQEGFGATIEKWQNPIKRMVAVYPMGDDLTAQTYGERSSAMMKLIASRMDGLNVGDGAWLDNEDRDKPPLWRVERVERWPNQCTALLERRVEA